MEQNTEKLNENFLKAIYAELKSALQVNCFFADKTEDKKFKEKIKDAQKAYRRLSYACEDLADVYEIDLTDAGLIKKMQNWVNSKLGTMLNKSNRRIAGILILYAAKGTIEAECLLSDYAGCRTQFVEVAKELKEQYKILIENIREFLLIENNLNLLDNPDNKDKISKSSLKTADNKAKPKSKKPTSKTETKKAKVKAAATPTD